MELFEVLNNYCNRNSGAVDKSDKIKKNQKAFFFIFTFIALLSS